MSLEEGVSALHVAGRHARRLRGLRQRRLELDETTVLVTLLRVGRPEVTARQRAERRRAGAAAARHLLVRLLVVIAVYTPRTRDTSQCTLTRNKHAVKMS